jgi:hypothetical protein
MHVFDAVPSTARVGPDPRMTAERVSHLIEKYLSVGWTRECPWS